MPAYIPAVYWEAVAQRLAERDCDSGAIAGDSTDFYRRKRALFAESLLAPATAHLRQVLEVGCGPGGNLVLLAGCGKQVVGADISPRMLAHARRRLPGVALTLMDGRRLPFADRGFEAVMTATVLQHNPPAGADALLAELARVAASEVHLFEDTACVSVRDRRSHWLRRPRWYVDRMAAAGFELVAMRRLPLAAQEIAAAAVRAALERGHREGGPASRRRQRLEAASGRVARLADGLLPAGVGLTRMSFWRP